MALLSFYVVYVGAVSSRKCPNGRLGSVCRSIGKPCVTGHRLSNGTLEYKLRFARAVHYKIRFRRVQLQRMSAKTE